MLKYIDIHAHLEPKFFKDDLAGVIERMVEKDVGAIAIGVDYETSKDAIEIAKKHDFIWAGIGLHPADNVKEIFDFDKYLELAKNPKVVCIGECGLDYYRCDEGSIVRQKRIFIEQIKFANEVNKPLMVHIRNDYENKNRNAYTDALEILKQYSRVRGVVHFFEGDLKDAEGFLSLGFAISFTGAITYPPRKNKRNCDYEKIIKNIPLDMVFSDTDSPYVAPAPYRGKTCEPFMVAEVVKKIAEIKNLPEEEVVKAILANARRFFGI